MGFDLLVLGRSSDNVGGPSHLNYFHPGSLRLLLESCEFDVLEVLTPGELDAELVKKKAENLEFSLKNRPFLQKVLSEDWDSLGKPFQRFLAENKLSSHMWVVARKKGS